MTTNHSKSSPQIPQKPPSLNFKSPQVSAKVAIQAVNVPRMLSAKPWLLCISSRNQRLRGVGRICYLSLRFSDGILHKLPGGTSKLQTPAPHAFIAFQDMPQKNGLPNFVYVIGFTASTKHGFGQGRLVQRWMIRQPPFRHTGLSLG